MPTSHKEKKSLRCCLKKWMVYGFTCRTAIIRIWKTVKRKRPEEFSQDHKDVGQEESRYRRYAPITTFVMGLFCMSYYACKKMNYPIAFSIFLRYTHLKASVYNLFSNNLKINGSRTDSLCFSRNYFTKIKRAKGIRIHSVPL